MTLVLKLTLVMDCHWQHSSQEKSHKDYDYDHTIVITFIQ